MDAAQAILRKTPPADLEKNLRGIGVLLKENVAASEALQNKHQLPFHVFEDVEGKDKPFLMCRYNRVGDKHRSPWTNQLYPRTDDDAAADRDLQSDDDNLRLLEAKINGVWESYKNLYYGHDSVGSVYLRDRGPDMPKGAFLGVFGIQKVCSAGSWNSLHIMHVDEPEEKTCNYRVESSVVLVLNPNGDDSTGLSKVDLSAALSKESSKTCKISQATLTSSHIENIGTLIEANEIDLRSSMERVHVPKTQEIMNDIQKSEPKKPVQVNPLMGMIMGSDLLKKKLASEAGGT